MYCSVAAKPAFRIQVSLRVPEYHILWDIVTWVNFLLQDCSLGSSHYYKQVFQLAVTGGVNSICLKQIKTQSGESRREKKERVMVMAAGEKRMMQAAPYSC